MTLHSEIIEVAAWLRRMNSPCHYEDFYNVLRKRFDDKFLARADWKRIMRHLKAHGVFYGSDGQFIINNQLFEKLEVGKDGNRITS